LVKDGEAEIALPIPSADIPASAMAVIESIKNHDDVVRAAQVKQAAVAWVSRNRLLHMLLLGRQASACFGP